MKQYKIDNGQIGGIIQIIGSSTLVLSPLSFIGILALNYDKYFSWIDPKIFAITSIFLFLAFEWVWFAIIFPSYVQFGNRQQCTHDNPIFISVQEISKRLDKIEGKLK